MKVQGGLCKKHEQQLPEKLEQRLKWQQKNVERRKQSLKKYHASNKHKDTHLIYRKTPGGRYNVLERSASERGIKLEISREAYDNFMQKEKGLCHYCKNTVGAGSSLDRKDSSRHYYLDNVVCCCGSCNKLKNNLLSHEETIQVISLIKTLRNKDDIWE